MGSMTNKIRRNMIEKQYGVRTSISKLKREKAEEDEERKARAEQRRQWDEIKRGKK